MIVFMYVCFLVEVVCCDGLYVVVVLWFFVELLVGVVIVGGDEC